MRRARQKLKNESCYYHLMNRICGPKEGNHPFTDVDRELGFQIVQEACRYFLLEVISAAWMGNHFHLVVYSPSDRPSNELIAARHDEFFERRRVRPAPLDPEDHKACSEVAEDMLDISAFMRWIQVAFSSSFNRRSDRRGSLWAGRFKSVIIESGEALETLVKYVELNPVRSGLADDPADYRFCSWGRFSGSGRHPFRENFLKHMKKCSPRMAKMSEKEIYAEFRASLARTIARERGATCEQADQAARAARAEVSMPVRFLARTRYFSDGAIIGSKGFVQEMASRFRDRTRVMDRQLPRGFDGKLALYSFKRLRSDA